MAWTLIKSDHGMGEASRMNVFMAGSSDITTPPDPDNSAPGSIVFTADMTTFYVKAEDGTWTESTSDALALIGMI